MKTLLLSFGVVLLINSQTASAQSFKKIGYSASVASGVVSAVLVAVSVSNAGGGSNSDNAQTSEPKSDSGNTSQPKSESGQSDSGQSESGQSQSNGKANLALLEDDYFSYLQDYQSALGSGLNFEVNDIKQPYVKEVMLGIMSNEELVGKIEQEVEGVSTLDKINKVLTQELLK